MYVFVKIIRLRHSIDVNEVGFIKVLCIGEWWGRGREGEGEKGEGGGGGVLINVSQKQE